MIEGYADLYWCPLCGGDIRAADHEDACRLKLSQLRPMGIVNDRHTSRMVVISTPAGSSWVRESYLERTAEVPEAERRRLLEGTWDEVDVDDRTDALLYALSSLGARRPDFLVDAIYTAASTHAQYGPDDERYLEVWEQALAEYRGEGHEQFYIRDARIIMEREWTLNSGPKFRTTNHDDGHYEPWFKNLFNLNLPIDVEGQEHAGNTSTEARALGHHGDESTSGGTEAG